jgi:hypothetical protein
MRRNALRLLRPTRAFAWEDGVRIVKAATRSLHAAQRNAGAIAQPLRRFPDCAALHPGYILWLSRNRGLAKSRSGQKLMALL